jgi:4-amino-4-deoxy-L-arabinose transferase-like glycosyltransferase
MNYMRRPFWPAIWITLTFLFLGLPFLQRTGLHYDASSELACFYSCSHPVFRPTVFGQPVPIMVIPYLGSLKAWLYLPILKYLDVTPLVLRLPFLFAGAASVWLFFSLLDRVAGRRAAIAGAVLLATDASFLIATSYDFGPIALLHLFLLSGILLLLRFEKTRDSRHLALAFFLFGLALWHKALFVWMLGGLAAASAVVIPKRILAPVTPARIAIAVLSFGIGASPLIYYNAATDGATLHTGNIMSGTAPLAQKILVFKKTMNSSVLFGWLTEDLHPETARSPSGIAGKVSVKLNSITGGLRSNWMLYALVASCLLVPWLWFTPARRPALFALIYLIVAWGLMAILPNTGATVHHVLLLWPFPHFLIAVAGAQIAAHFKKYGDRALMAVLVVIVAGNALVINHYYADLATRGPTVIWTDAINPLFRRLDSLEGQRIVTVDWGYSSTLCLLSDGDMPLQDISYILLEPSPQETAYIRSLIAQPKTLFVDHMADGQQFPGVREHLERIAAEGGYRKEVLETVKDRNQRPRFEISRYTESR